MPALSPTMEAGTITDWKMAPGDEVAPGDVLCEVETDKATVAYEMQDDGVLAKILAPAGGGELKVGSPMAITVDDMEDYQLFLAADEQGKIMVPGEVSSGAEPVEASAAAPAAAGTQAAAAVVEGRTVPLEYLFSPAARHMAQSKGVDASSIAGTGKGGRITKSDLVHALNSGKTFPTLGSAPAVAAASDHATNPAVAIAGAGAPAPAPAPASAAVPSATASPPAAAPQPRSHLMNFDFGPVSSKGSFIDIPASQITKVIARRLTESKATVPHYYVSVECEIDSLLGLRKKLATEADTKVSVNDLVIKSAALALRDVPEVNASWSPKGRKINDSIDVSVAVATPAGLITPIVTDVDKKGLAEINSNVVDLAARAKDNKLKPEEFQGGTFTISNLGMFGINEFSAVINPPQSSIMAVGGGVRRVLPGKGVDADGCRNPPRVATVMTTRLSCDRRVVDEAVAGQFLQAFQFYVQSPSQTMHL
ncbi:unnamed protein product [Chrysoparadoxa australica]